MRKIVFTLALLAFLGAAQAQSFRIFMGLPSTALIVGGSTVPLLGLHVGSYNLGGGVGSRLVIESNLGLAEVALTQGSVDALFSTGEATTLYGGVGAGYILLGELDGLYANAFVGVDFDSATAISYFIEANPRLYVDGGSSFGAFVFRAGMNFAFGDTSGGVSGVQGTCCVIP